MKNELITIIVPVYNVENYLIKCIESLINQTYTNLEILLINDGSTDNSLKICEEYSMVDKRIKVFNKENGGLSDARNYGIEHSRGKYLLFVDSDDYIHTQAIEILYSSLKKNLADISFAKTKNVYENDQFIIKNINISNYNEILYDPKSFYFKMYSLNSVDYNIIPNRLYKKSLFSDIRFPVGKLHEDSFTLYKLIFKCTRIVEINENLYFYLMRENSIMHSQAGISNFDFLDVPKVQMDFYYKHKLYDVYRRCAFFNFLGLVNTKFTYNFDTRSYLINLYNRKKLGFLKIIIFLYLHFPFIIDIPYTLYKKYK